MGHPEPFNLTIGIGNEQWEKMEISGMNVMRLLKIMIFMTAIAEVFLYILENTQQKLMMITIIIFKK